MDVHLTSVCVFFILGWRMALTVPIYSQDTPATRDQPSRTVNGAITYLTGRFYNPMDPTGYIFEGNNKQYTIGNGKDTPSFDPSMYAYMFKGDVVNKVPVPVTQSPYGILAPSNLYSMNMFLPSSNFLRPQSVNSNQNSGTKQTVNELTASPAPQNNVYHGNDSGEESVANITKTERVNTTPENKDQDGDEKSITRASNSSLPPSKPDPNQAEITTPSTTATYENRYDKNTLDGIGNLAHLYIPKYPSPVNFTGNSNSSPILYGRPGALGSENQPPGSAKDFYPVFQNKTTLEAQLTSVPDPAYSGYPGMLGASGLTQNRNIAENTFDERPNNISTVNPNSSEAVFAGSGVLQVTNLNVNSWKGDWPGATGKGESGETDNWYDGWTHNESGEAEESHQTKSSADLTKPSVGDAHQSGTGSSAWDGSWPGRDSVLPASKVTTVSQSSSTVKPPNPDELKEAMQVLGTLAAYLKGQFLPVQSTNNVGGSSRAYSDMAGDWAKDIRG